MIIIKCYKFRLMPTPKQEQTFLSFSGCRRFVWNWALEQKNTHYKKTGKSLKCKDLSTELVHLKKLPDTAFLKECQSQILQQTLMDLEKAFKNFFEKRAGYPRWKSRRRTHHSFRIPQRIRIVGGKVFIPKVGLVKVVLHRDPEGTLKSATIKQQKDGHWNITIVSHIELPDIKVPAPASPVGVDVGLESFLTLDSGEKIQPPKFHRKSERKIKHLQRQLSRSQQGSKLRAKRKRRLATVHQKVKNQRSDFLHKLSSRLIKKYDLICIEDLNMTALARTKLRGHAKSWKDASQSSFRQMLDYKSEWNYRQVVRVDRWYPSSKTCHSCGHIQTLTMSDRTWTCERCEMIHDRDTNAAINLLSEGLRIVACGTQETQNASGGNVRLTTVSDSR